MLEEREKSKKSIQFSVPIEPTGKARARKGGSGIWYTPSATAQAEDVVRQCWRQQLHLEQAQPFEQGVPLAGHITARYKIPKSFSKKKRELALTGKLRPLTKPDCDNIEKLVYDSLNSSKKKGQGAYHDDSQLVQQSICKIYSEAPGITVTIYEIDTTQPPEIDS